MRITTIHQHLSSLRIALILALCMVAVQMAPAQNLDVSRSTVTKIADLLNRFPAENAAAFEQAMKQMAALEEAELVQMAQMFSEKANNENLQYALSRVGFHSGTESSSEQSAKAGHDYGKAVDQVTYAEAKAFLMESLRIVGSDEAIADLAP